MLYDLVNDVVDEETDTIHDRSTCCYGDRQGRSLEYVLLRTGNCESFWAFSGERGGTSTVAMSFVGSLAYPAFLRR